ncbi:MAG: DUF6323 family protein [Raoultibacter sp.]
MDIHLMLQPTTMNRKTALHELAIVNTKTECYGLALTEEQVGALAERRVDALKTMGRVEFGRGVLHDIVLAFASSPYLTQDSYSETLGDLQDVFYRLKETSEEQIADDDLIDAMRRVFDDEANGSVEYLGEMTATRLLAEARRGGQDANEDWSEHDSYEKESDDSKDGASDGVDRVFEGEQLERPDADYAVAFYEDYDEMFRIKYDTNGRIGGSSLG